MSKTPTRNSATRVLVISDLHVGGRPPHMMSRPDRLASFIRSLPARKRPDEDLELVIAGDFVDFLAIPEFEAFTEDPTKACEKLSTAMDAEPFEQVFAALAELVLEHHLTILVGNHDLELALPSVQEALLTKLQARPHQVLFVDDGRAYRIGRALIEHGNRYDPANWNDWDGLRAIASAQSRGEPPAQALVPSTGSLLVERVINNLKVDYPFVDLLQPEGVVQALLLAELETPIASALAFFGAHLRSMPFLWQASRERQRYTQAARPASSRNIAATPAESVGRDPALEGLFGGNYLSLVESSRSVGFADWVPIPSVKENGLAHLLRTDGHISPNRMKRIREALRRIRRTTELVSEPPDGLAVAAKRLVEAGATDVVVMGHTHESREHFWKGDGSIANYVNTGTWADLIRVSDEVIDGGDDILRDFLSGLFRTPRPDSVPTFAELRIESSGMVSAARLEFFRG